MKKLLRQLKSTRGEGYVDITVAVLIIMILLAGVIKNRSGFYHKNDAQFLRKRTLPRS